MPATRNPKASSPPARSTDGGQGYWLKAMKSNKEIADGVGASVRVEVPHNFPLSDDAPRKVTPPLPTIPTAIPISAKCPSFVQIVGTSSLFKKMTTAFPPSPPRGHTAEPPFETLSHLIFQEFLHPLLLPRPGLSTTSIVDKQIDCFVSRFPAQFWM